MDVGLRELVKIYMRRMIGNLMDDSVQGTPRTQFGRTTRPVSPSHGVDRVRSVYHHYAQHVSDRIRGRRASVCASTLSHFSLIGLVIDSPLPRAPRRLLRPDVS